jgi:CheY-like chemotaxis protein
MIQVLIVEDNQHKRDNISKIIFENNKISKEDVHFASCVKDAKIQLYNNYYDLMILDLVLPVEKDGEAKAEIGVKFLNEISYNPSIKPPIHIVGLSGFKEKVTEYHEQFSSKLWNLINYDASSENWKDKLDAIIFHLVKTRERFIQTPTKQINTYFSTLKESGFPNTFLGGEWKDFSNNLCKIIEYSFDIPSKFANGSHAKNINSNSIKISSEYDFQNLIHLVLRPWLPSLEAENIAIIFDGNTKNADFSINRNSVIIEAKYIDTTGKKNDTMKTIEGLKNFYKQNGNVKALLFLLLVNDNVEIDSYKIENEFSDFTKTPVIQVKVIHNILK